MNVRIISGIPEHDQVHSFTNATLQGHREFAFSIACRVNVPDHITIESELQAYLAHELMIASLAAPAVEFEVQTGSAS